MREKLKKLFQTRGFEVSIYAILLVLAVNGLVVFNYQKTIKKTVELKEDLLEIQRTSNLIAARINRADMALRGYLLIADDGMLGPYRTSLEGARETMEEFEVLAKKIGYNEPDVPLVKKSVLEYLDLVKQMVQMAQNGNVEEAVELLRTDPGLTAWLKYGPIQSKIDGYASDLNEKTKDEYEAIMKNMWVSQIIFLLISIPFLIAVARKLRKSQLNRDSLFKTLIKNQKKYLFDSREFENAEVNEQTIIEGLVEDLQKASYFINSITEGNYNVSWEGLDENNWTYNENNLSGELTKMRDQMIKVKKEDDTRLWITEGLSKFNELIRTYQNNLTSLSDNLVSQLVKYLNAKQGGIFILNDDNEYDKHLELTGCYAYERKKYLEKKVMPGEGLVGQCYLEKEHIYLKNIPENYVSITSGLGETNPRSLLLVPIKNESAIIGVIEIASLSEFHEYQIDFVNQLSESIASAISNVKINENTTALLERTQQQAEEMRAQEEEMRQNMEELQATQESLHRESQEKEKVQADVESAKNFLQKIINALPDPIFVKDRKHRFVMLNDAVCEFNGWKREEVLGKTDFDFFSKEEAQPMFNHEEDLFRTKEDVEVETEATRAGKKTYVIDKKRIIEDDNGNLFIVGINIDISQLKQVERDLAKEKYLLDAMLDNMPDSIYFKDEKSRFIRASRSMVEAFGFESAEELIGKTDFDFQDAEHAQQAFEDESEIIRSEKPMIDMVEKEVFEDGSIRWVSTTKMPLRDLNNKVVGTFGISRDISKIKNMEIGYQSRLEEVIAELQEKEDEIKKLKAK